jgi:hypothetical protein
MRNVRTAVIVLIFVNLVFMAWAHWIDVPLEPPVNQAAARLPQLVLASEAPARVPTALKAVPAAASPTSEAAAPTMTPTARRCVSVGPFNDLAQETHAAAFLQERGFAPQQRTEDGDVRDGFWVYVGGIKSSADETDRSRAERRARVVEHLGFSPDIVERRRPGTVYWVDLDLGTSDAAVPTEGLAPADQGGSRIQVRVCP